MIIKHGKVVIIGAGFVGSAVLNAVLRMKIGNHIVMVNRSRERALGEVLDASHTTAFAYSPNVRIEVGSHDDCADAQLIIMTAGPSIKPGNTANRMVLLNENAKIMREVMSEISSRTREAILIIVSNPVDILVYIAQSEFNYPREKVIGTGTLIDTARFNKVLGDICGVDAKNVVGFVLGEHGPHSFVAWDSVNIAGIPFSEFEAKFGLSQKLDKAELMQTWKSVGLNIVELKGYTSSGVALSACRIAAAIANNEKCVIPAAVTLNGEYGISGVAFSMPCVVSENGVDRVLELELDPEAQKALNECAAYLKEMIAQVK
jgi:Malate/lactate dehydrogenases